MKHNKVLIDRSHLEFLLFASLRYCLGRKTYVTSTYEDVIKRTKHLIHHVVKEKLAGEVREALHDAKRNGKLLGHACDQESWEEVLHALTIKPGRGD